VTIQLHNSFFSAKCRPQQKHDKYWNYGCRQLQ